MSDYLSLPSITGRMSGCKAVPLYDSRRREFDRSYRLRYSPTLKLVILDGHLFLLALLVGGGGLGTKNKIKIGYIEKNEKEDRIRQSVASPFSR